MAQDMDHRILTISLTTTGTLAFSYHALLRLVEDGGLGAHTSLI